jgi:hypothetical protein
MFDLAEPDRMPPVAWRSVLDAPHARGMTAGYGALICPTGKSLAFSFFSCPALWRKINRFAEDPNQNYIFRCLILTTRGGSRSSRTLGWDAVDALATQDERR